MTPSAVLGAVFCAAGAALLAIGVLGWLQRLPRNRFVGVRTPAALRSELAFDAANRVAAPPVLAGGMVCAGTGGLAFGSAGGTLAVLVTVAGVAALILLLAGGLLGNRAATAMTPSRPVRPAGCGGCACDTTEQCADRPATSSAAGHVQTRITGS